MKIAGFPSLITAVAALTACGAFGQSVISAKAGVIHYVEGDATVTTGKEVTPVEVKTGGRYNDLKEGQEMATTEGRAEVLLNPGVFLRMGESTRVKMISSRLSDTRLDLLGGVALVEVTEVSKDNAITILVKDAAVSFSKTALVRLDAENGIRVYKGEAQVMAGGTPQVLREGREMQLVAGFPVVKFDPKQGDSLYRWANRRAEYIAMANIASANMAQKNYNRSSFAGAGVLGGGGWFYNPYYGMMTYLPYGNGMYRSPFGYSYFGPLRVGAYYRNYMQAALPQMNSGGGGLPGGGSNRTWNSDNGYYTTQSRSAGPVSIAAPSGGGAAAAAPAAPAARGADAGSARGGGASAGGRGR